MNPNSDTAAERIRAWWTARPAPGIRPEDECFDLTIHRPILRVLDIPELLAERDALAQRVAELEGTEPEMQYRATGLRVTVGITEEDLLEDGWDGWTLEQRAVRPGPWTPVDAAKFGAR